MKKLQNANRQTNAKIAKENRSKKRGSKNKWYNKAWGHITHWWRGMPKWLRVQVPVFVTMGVLALSSLVTIIAMPNMGQDIIGENSGNTKSGWAKHTVAPFVDMTSWVNPSSTYSINGASDVGEFANSTGLKYFCLGFINPVQTNPVSSDGTINWAWGGFAGLGKGSTSTQYQGIVQSIKNLSDKGGMYVVSVGGQAGNAPWKVSQNKDKLVDFYLDIIDTYKIKRLDLDIEESNQDADHNQINANAIKKVQDKTGVEIVLTLPIMPSGWQQKQIDIIKAYLNSGVKISMINSMCMCYGTGVWANEDYGDASIRAIENSIKQMQDLFSSYGIPLTEQQAYAKTGCTVSIGYESSLYPTFTTDMMKKVAAHAKQHNYGMLSFWSMGRDSTIDGNKGINSAYAYTKICQSYLEK